jgi:glycosyltransferase involved in cell wall biosynthesis
VGVLGCYRRTDLIAGAPIAYSEAPMRAPSRPDQAGRPSAAVFLVDTDRGSYSRAADLYAAAFDAAGIGVDVRPHGGGHRDGLAGRWVVQHTIGPLFEPIAGATNTAVVFHEWSRYPSEWLATLNRFESVWAPSRHVEDVLRRSGLAAPLHYVPPPLSFTGAIQRTSWSAGTPFRLLAVGEPHFRKGFHLLLEGYRRAFPSPGEAELTLKVSPACTWDSPRADIRLVRERLSPEALARLYTGHDALVSTSLGEGLGLPIAEAVDTLMPVVTNLWGGHCDIVSADGAWVISHEEVPQLFCSAPSFYADGQCCAYSSPDRIAAALRAVVSATPAEREARARVARAALVARHGVAAAAGRIRQLTLAS